MEEPSVFPPDRRKRIYLSLIILAVAMVLHLAVVHIEDILNIDYNNFWFTTLRMILGLPWYIVPGYIAWETRNPLVRAIVIPIMVIFCLNLILSSYSLFSIYMPLGRMEDPVYFQF